MSKISVLGAGTWGIALARLLHNAGHQVLVWSSRADGLRRLDETRRHPHLPDCVIPAGIRFVTDMAEACRDQDLLVFAVPSVQVRSTAALAAPHLPRGQAIVDVAKGIEAQSLLGMTGIIADELKKAGKQARLAALSGPTHAEEVSQDMPSAIVAASEDSELAAYIQALFSTPHFRVYTSSDLHGVELCGAMKNVMALASGIAHGLGYGDNTKAALITRAMAELSRLGVAMGCRTETFMGLAGVGDLIVTATSPHSRNNRAGYLIGRGMIAEEATREVGMVVEGLNALPAALILAERYGVDMPILFAVRDVVYNGKDPQQAVDELMLRNT